MYDYTCGLSQQSSSRKERKLFYGIESRERETRGTERRREVKVEKCAEDLIIPVP